MDLRQFCKLYRDITKQLRHTHSHKDEEWERVDCIGEVIKSFNLFLWTKPFIPLVKIFTKYVCWNDWLYYLCNKLLKFGIKPIIILIPAKFPWWRDNEADFFNASPPSECLISFKMGNVCVTKDHFTVVCLVAWPLNESEAGVDLVLIETLLLFICKFLLISMRTAILTWEKQGGFYQNKVSSSLTFIQRPGN